MKIWLIKDGEQLPLIEGAKKMRTWRLGEELARRGHDVTWFSSTFFHLQKKKLSEKDSTYKISDTFQLEMLESGHYKKNLSLARVKHHKRFAKRFYERTKVLEKPDIIVAAHPIIEVCHEAIKFGKKHNIPVIIDARDKWPDTFKDYFPKILSPLISLATCSMQRKTTYNFKLAHALVSMSPDLLNWAIKKTALPKRGAVFYLGCDDSAAGDLDQDHRFHTLMKSCSNKTVYLYLGVIGSTYDIETILKIAQKTEDNQTSIFLIAGDGPQFENLKKQYVNLRNIHFLGWVTKNESHFLIEKCDVFLIPCFNQAIPNKLFEGLKYGKPILFTLYGEGKTILENNECGFYYKPKDEKALLSLIQKMQDKELREKISLNAKRLYQTEMNSKVIYEQYADFIESIQKEGIS